MSSIPQSLPSHVPHPAAFCAGAPGCSVSPYVLRRKVLSHFFAAFSKLLPYKQLGKTHTELESRFCFAVIGIQCSQAPSAQVAPRPGPRRNRPELLITRLADFCFLFTSLRKIHADREVASKLETFFSFLILKVKKGNRNISPQRPMLCTPMFTISGFLISKLKLGLLLTVLPEMLPGPWQRRAFQRVHWVQGGFTLLRNALQV